MITPHRLVPPTALTGVTMAAYLLLRPYGDGGSAAEAAHAFASPRWVLAHLCGVTALASFAWLAARIAQALDERASRLAAGGAVLGAALVLPYYGSETFALHALGQRALTTDLDVLDLAEHVRFQPAAVVMFGVGLLLLAAGALVLARRWQRATDGRAAGALWPLAIAVACVLPQFYLPVAGRVAFGIAYLAAAAVFASLASSGRARPALSSSSATPASASPRS